MYQATQAGRQLTIVPGLLARTAEALRHLSDRVVNTSNLFFLLLFLFLSIPPSRPKHTEAPCTKQQYDEEDDFEQNCLLSKKLFQQLILPEASLISFTTLTTFSITATSP